MVVEQGLTTGKEKPQSLNILKFLRDPSDLLHREVSMQTISDIAVAALEIAPTGEQDLKVPKRGNRGWIGEYISHRRNF